MEPKTKEFLKATMFIAMVITALVLLIIFIIKLVNESNDDTENNLYSKTKKIRIERKGTDDVINLNEVYVTTKDGKTLNKDDFTSITSNVGDWELYRLTNLVDKNENNFGHTNNASYVNIDFMLKEPADIVSVRIVSRPGFVRLSNSQISLIDGNNVVTHSKSLQNVLEQNVVFE